MPLVIEEATRAGIVPLVGVYGKSASGKTHSALLLARGIAGDKPIAIVDTENKRSGIFTGMIPGGFKQVHLDPQFTPDRYVEAIKVMEDFGVGCGVIDSMSHEWSGEGGVLEWQEAELQRMAGDDYKRRETCKFAAWIKPKERHKALVKYILRCRIPLVCCLRADEKIHIQKRDGQKTEVITDEFTTPDFDKKFIYEMLCNMETVQHEGKPGCCRVTKWSHPEVLALLPKPGQQISIEHGAALARWCARTGDGLAATTAAPPKTKTTGKTTPEALRIKRELWDVTKSIHYGEVSKLEQWLWDENLLDTDEILNEQSEARLRVILADAKKKLKK